MSGKARSFCYTLNNWTENEIESLRKVKCKYQIIGKEVGESGTNHLQGYLSFDNPRSFNAIRKICPRWHLEIARGSPQDNYEYCTKEGNYEEFGERPEQGKRTDLNEIKNEIINGKKIDDIVMEQPMIYHQYGRTLHKIEDLVMRKKYRTEMTQGIWYWGETGTGKSHKAFEGFTPETHYVWTNDKGWWDGYTQQDTVILNDFRGELRYNELLNLVDKFPHSVSRRNRETIPFTSKTVIITSSLPPEKIYKHRDEEDKIEQLLRRFKIERLSRNGTEVLGGNTRPLAQKNALEYINIDDIE